MACTVGLAQTRFPEDADVPAMVERACARAADAGVRLLVFPEALMTRFEDSLERFWAAAQPLDGPFAAAVRESAARHGLWVVFTMNERNDAADDPRPYNTAVVADAHGAVRGVYRKAHLFDAQGFKESDRMAAGPALPQVVEGTPAGKLGLGICYDLRFPELARAQAAAGADLLVYPAAWVAGEGKARQWRTLLAARAIESGCYVAGCGSADPGRCGASAAYDPFGAPLVELPQSEEPALATFACDAAVARKARSVFPTIAHRRPPLYPR